MNDCPLGPKLEQHAIFSETEYDCCVIGIGRLGLCFALTLERAGLRVCGVDVNPDYIKLVNEKKLVTQEPGLTQALAESTVFDATTNVESAVTSSKLIFILVPTPTDGGKHYYDHSILSNVLVKLNKMRLKGKSIVICSTVFPGYINRIGKLLLDQCVDCTLNYNPAFVAQGDVMSGYRTGGWFGMVLIGSATSEDAAVLTEIYERISGPGSGTNVCIVSPASAEICKLASNCFRTTKISFANMIGDIADRTPGADKFEICNALKQDKSIGHICMTPGFGYGGPCYPRDNKALAKYAEDVGVKPLIPKATDEYNEFHHNLMMKAKLAENFAEYIFENVTYKPKCAVAMIDHSPKLAIAYSLAQEGKKVKIKDRFDVVLEVMKDYGDIFEYETVSDEGGDIEKNADNGVY